MRNPTVFRAQFSGLIKVIFGIPQTLKWKPELEIFQLRDSPEVWSVRMKGNPGRLEWTGPTPAALACLIESNFVERLTEWTPAVTSGASLLRRQPKNVIVMPLKREA